MRYWFLPLAVVLLSFNAGSSQDKKKDKDKEPPKEISVFAGKNFATWKKELHHPDPAEREVAIRAIVNFPLGKVYTALPDILQELKKHNNPVPVDQSVRVNGIIAVGQILQAKRQPDEDLVEYLKGCEKKKEKPDPKRVESLFKKSQPDPKYVADAVTIFRGGLKDTQIILKVRAAQALPLIGTDARKLLPEVIQICKDPLSWEVRKEGLLCLTILAITDKGKPDMKLVPEFVRRLEDSAAEVRMVALRTLGNMGAAAEDSDKAHILAKLKTAETDKDFRVRIAAHVAIMHAQHKVSKDHLSTILNYAENLDPRVRLAAIHGLAAAGPDGKKAMTTIVPSLLGAADNDEQIEVRLAALAALPAIHAFEAIKDLGTLKTAYEKKNPVLSRAAEDTIDQMNFMMKAEKEMKEKKDNDKKGGKK